MIFTEVELVEKKGLDITSEVCNGYRVEASDEQVHVKSNATSQPEAQSPVTMTSFPSSVRSTDGVGKFTPTC